jgi:hypothetical protein
MTISEWGFEIKSPGELLPGLSVNNLINLIHGVPVYEICSLRTGPDSSASVDATFRTES